MIDRDSARTKKLFVYFVVGTSLTIVSVLAFEARFTFHWMRDVSLVSTALTSPGYFLYDFFLNGFAGLPKDPLWLRYALASITNGFVYAGVAFMLPLFGIESTKKQLVVFAVMLLAFSATFLCLWEGCYRLEYWF